MKFINISITIENYGIFYVDQYMKISFFPNKDWCWILGKPCF